MAGTICDNPAAYAEQLGQTLRRIDFAAVGRLAELLREAANSEKRIYVMGNGGSAATAGHWVADLVKNTAVDGKPRLAVLSLTDNYSLTTALGNDISFEESLRFPLSAYGRRGDIAIAISVSGNSPNLIRACQWAKENGLTVVGLSGFSGGKLGQIADLHINIPSDNYGVVEDLHLAIGHMVAQAVAAR